MYILHNEENNSKKPRVQNGEQRNSKHLNLIILSLYNNYNNNLFCGTR